ncbi:MAG: pyridoxal-dependent decarboxylase [candidate division NC10 bacterium]|nr:pyridoxal-dependent decarboxylase [candidate division NC10 bacterium]
MDPETFRRYGHELVDWVANYLKEVDKYPVLSPASPGEVRNKIPASPPQTAEPMEAILKDFQEILLPGITHWNHPRFFAYFPANNSGPSILAELLTAGLGVNAMLWQTSPAATELEEVVMDWLRQMLGLPEGFRGCIQDTASTATLCALLCARERTSQFQINSEGFSAWPGSAKGLLRVYASSEAHSSVEKGLKIAGFGSANLVLVSVDEAYAMDPEDLEKRIQEDRKQGFSPCCVVATVGTTSSTALDPLRPIGEIAGRHGLWLHVDAALAGSAAILPEMRWILEGIEQADSFVFNPHKWLFTNFDCSAFFCRHPQILTSTFSILPEYLKTDLDRQVTNFRDWGIQLGRKFRALKLWFVLRYYGVKGLQDLLRQHLALAQEFKRWVEESPDFELLAPVPLNTICFRFHPGKRSGRMVSGEELERLNKNLLDEVNRSGQIFMTHTRLKGNFSLRLCIGQTQTRGEHVEQAWEALRKSRVAQEGRQA